MCCDSISDVCVGPADSVVFSPLQLLLREFELDGSESSSRTIRSDGCSTTSQSELSMSMDSTEVSVSVAFANRLFLRFPCQRFDLLFFAATAFGVDVAIDVGRFDRCWIFLSGVRLMSFRLRSIFASCFFTCFIFPVNNLFNENRKYDWFSKRKEQLLEWVEWDTKVVGI